MLPHHPAAALAALRVQRWLNAKAVRGINTHVSDKQGRHKSKAAIFGQRKWKVPEDVRRVNRENREQQRAAPRLKLQAAYGRPIATVTLDNGPASSPSIHSKADPEFIASWNVDTAQSVHIPGEPPLLINPSASSVVLRKATEPVPDVTKPPDEQNFVKALLKSVRSLTPDFQFKSLDVFTWGKNVVKLSQLKDPFVATKVPGGPMLLRFNIRNALQGTAPGSPEKETVIKSIAHSMTRQYTELPSSHFRVIRYMFGSLSLGVPAGIDAWDPVRNQEIGTPESLPTAPRPKPNSVVSGQPVNQSALVWLKDDVKSLNPQSKIFFMKAWFSRIQHLRLGGRPSNGGRVQVRHASLDMALGEAEHQVALQQIHHVLTELKTSIAKTSTGIICGIPMVDRGGSKYWELYEVDDTIPEFQGEMTKAKQMAEYDARPTKAV